MKSNRAWENKAESTEKLTTSYLDQLDAKHLQLLGKEREAICSQPPIRKQTSFPENAFMKLLAEKLQCTLKDADQALVRHTCRSCSGLEQSITCTALERAIAQWGCSRYVSVYLEATASANRSHTPAEVIHHTPFGKDLLPEQLYSSTAFRELKERLRYVIERVRIMAVTGEVGAGKSTTLRAVNAQIPTALYRCRNRLTHRVISMESYYRCYV